MITINKSLLSNAVDSMNHAINAIVDAADAIAAIAIDIVEQVFTVFEPQVATVQQPAIEVEIETIPPQNDRPCVYVPVIWHGPERYEVFTTKWSGMIVEAKNLTDLALKIGSGRVANEYGKTRKVWICGTASVAIMRARDAISMETFETHRKAYAIKIQP